MPKTKVGEKVMKQMQKEHGKKEGEHIFYASVNAGVPGSDKWHKGGMKGRPAPVHKKMK